MAHPPASAPPTTTRTAAPSAAHFARLTAIWALDRHIPWPASRAAWAAARGLDAAKVQGIEIPEGSCEMEVGDVEAEEEEERKARDERAKRKQVTVKKEAEEVKGVGMKKEEDEAQGRNGTGHAPVVPQTFPAPKPLAQGMVAVLPPSLVSIHKPSSTLGAVPACIAPYRSAPAHKSLEAAQTRRNEGEEMRSPPGQDFLHYSQVLQALLQASQYHRSSSCPARSASLSGYHLSPLADVDIDDPVPTAADPERALYEGLTFTPCIDISLSALPFLFGLDACGFQFGGISFSPYCRFCR
ncbi:hypothetical protein DFP72DRAFT_1177466 [Ephemerocybe angulata]|uniref:Uncharacterized protein n=1 Tax=Ephemerocybe angulata TaxID=980116 RepID=A0A8H6HCV0_9AGAR|nr:hypothetical protein DFP72DRAFT_1177466 [Tulosesus angulatus]